MPSIYDTLNVTQPQAAGFNMTSPEEVQQMMKLKQLKDQQDQQAAMSVGAASKAGVLPAGQTQVSPASAPTSASGGTSDIEAQLRALMTARGGDLQSKRDELAKLAGAKPQGVNTLDISPMYNLVDALTGSHMLPGYKAPTEIDEWKAKQEKLKAGIDTGADKMSDDQLSYLKDKLRAASDDKRNAAMMGRMSSLDRRNQLSEMRLANTMGQSFDNDKTIISANNVLFGTSKATSLMNNPSVVVDGSVLGDINNDLSNALSGARNSTGGERLASHIQTAQGQIAGIMSRWGGKPYDALPAEYRTQINSIMRDLNDQTLAFRNERIAQKTAGNQFIGSDVANKLVNEKAANAKAYVPGAVAPSAGVKDPSQMTDEELTKEYLAHGGK